jgi:hypothetical protein
VWAVNKKERTTRGAYKAKMGFFSRFKVEEEKGQGKGTSTDMSVNRSARSEFFPVPRKKPPTVSEATFHHKCGQFIASTCRLFCSATALPKVKLRCVGDPSPERRSQRPRDFWLPPLVRKQQRVFHLPSALHLSARACASSRSNSNPLDLLSRAHTGCRSMAAYRTFVKGWNCIGEGGLLLCQTCSLI